MWEAVTPKKLNYPLKINMPRPLCPQCQRPEKQCYCQHLRVETAVMDIIILQHPKESGHPLNTARILELGLTNCQVWVGEDFSGHDKLLHTVQEKNACLLFPGPGAKSCGEVLHHSIPDVLIVLDGTWRKAKKIYYCNPVLQALPCIQLTHQRASAYRIRKAPGAGALSTVEATVALLREVTEQESVHQPLLDAFNEMIDLQIHAMGQKVFQRNYPLKG